MEDLLNRPLRPTNPSQGTFQLEYHGNEVDSGSMAVNELATALAAVGDAFRVASEILNGEGLTVDLRVLARFEANSFDINFVLHHILRDDMAAMLPAITAANPKQLLDAVLGTYDRAKDIVSGAAGVYKALRGEKPKEIREGSTGDVRIVVFGNNNTIVTEVNSARIYEDARFRNALTRAAEPLSTRGIDSLTIRREDQMVETLEQQDINAPAADEMLLEGEDGKAEGNTREIWVRVVKPNFDGGRWSFHDGSAKFGAELEDREFQSRVNQREVGFFKGDTFLVRLRSIQNIGKNGVLTTRNVVEKVLDQRLVSRQHNLIAG